MSVAAPDIQRHTWLEDAQAIIAGTLMIALGVNFYTQVGLLTGGTAGLAFLFSYISQFTFGQVFFVINLPFYWLSIRRIGWDFTLKTFLAVFLVSAFSDITPMFLHLADINPFYATIVGSFLIGVGFVMLFRHNASLGGLNILARYLFQTRGVPIGKFMMTVDCLVVVLSIFIVDLSLIAMSIFGAVLLNFMLVMNHKPGRYAVSP
ncbi:YitT family protein [Marinomonas ostreistagni]|uniref:YitT family protein n=1 Tax=Marinomonas ostreistagni TaxID=359209 RepID=UPI00195141E9|nr:YitT family protein [Marinomonas ostreistagni]MBM6549609.1 YitT family protein [Marinomonas ostreistagni]